MRRRIAAGLPLDRLSSGALASVVHLHSVRRMLSRYDGPLLRVRRSTDNAETDLAYADDGWLDASAAAAFAGGGDLLVARAYDQRDNSIEPRRNLWAWSENFGQSVWGKVRGAVAQNSDGSWRFTATETVAGENSLGQIFPAVAETTSVRFWIKRGNTDWVSVLIWDGTANVVRQWFNIATLTLGSNSQAGTAIAISAVSTITQDGDWIRLDVTTSQPSLTVPVRARLQIVEADATFASVSGNFVDVLRAQAGDGSFTAYQRTLDGTEFFARDAVQTVAGAQPALHIVPRVGRRNMFVTTRDMTAPPWGSFRATNTQSAIPLVDGSGLYMRSQSNATNNTGTGSAQQSFIGFPSGVYTIHVDVRPDPAGGWLCFRPTNNASFADRVNVWFNPATGEFGQIGASGASFGATPTASRVALPDGGWRVTVTFTTLATLDISARYYLCDGDTNLFCTIGRVFFLGRPQIESALETAYQTVNTSGTIVYEAGEAHDVRQVHDGSDDHIEAAAFAWGSDAATVVMAARKRADGSAAQTIAALAGGFEVLQQVSSGNSDHRFSSTGATHTRFANADLSAALGLDRVITLRAQTTAAGSIAAGYLDGALVGSDTSDQGGGNYPTAALAFGARADASQAALVDMHGAIAFNAAIDPASADWALVHSAMAATQGRSL